jgi:RNA polymerase sigma-70 factor, ECF subfamily
MARPSDRPESHQHEPGLDQQSESAKMASSGANQGPVCPSINLVPGERLDAGENRLDRSEKFKRIEAESSLAADTMGMSVALEGDARQAAAVKLAEEQALVRKAQSGDRLAFEDLVRRYDRDVLRLAMNLVHRPEDARDIYQESFLRVYRNLHRFRFECSFYTWLYRIVTNVGLDHLRRRTSHREDQAPVPEEAEGGTRDFFDRQPELSAAANPEKRLLGQELGKHIQEAMKRLSPRERMVFEMKHYQGLRLRAIGDLLGTSEETAKNSLFRATRKLRASLNPVR